MIGRGRVESFIAADPNDGTAVFNDDFGGLGPGLRGFLDGRRFVSRDAVDLRGVENGIVFQDANCFLAVIRFLVVDLIRLAEKDGRGFFALADLPSFFVGLLVGHPARIAALESPQVHAESKNIDAVITLAGDGIERALRALRPCPRPMDGPMV